MKPVKLKMPSESLSDGILFGLENTYAETFAKFPKIP